MIKSQERANPYLKLKEKLKEIEEKLNYEFKDPNLLLLSFVHRSFVNEYRQIINRQNERLEFLGDSVLGLIIADYLYLHLPNHPEGSLSHLRSHLVDASSCVGYLKKLKLEGYVLLGKGERQSQGKGRLSILANVFEAIIGAIYLDGGFLSAKNFVLGHFEELIQKEMRGPSRNYKARLQEYSQKKWQKPPTYKVIKEVGPDHSKEFTVVAAIDNEEIGVGIGSSKKEAEQNAASDALTKIEEKEGGLDM
jgi:ribonuclease III